MVRLFKHYIPTPVLILGLIESILLFVSAELAYRIRAAQIDLNIPPMTDRLGELVTYAAIVSLTMFAVGVYQSDAYRSVRLAVTRLSAAFLISFVAMSVVFFLFPDVKLWRSIFLYAIVLSLLFIFVARSIFSRFVGWRRFRRRIAVLGAGAPALQIKELSETRDSSFVVVRYFHVEPGEPKIAGAVAPEPGALATLTEREGIEEIVLALRERRGALAVDDLLQAKIAGTRISDMSSFLERETGRIDLASASPSWLIFSDGFLGAGQLSLIGKRAFDMLASALLLVVTLPILIVAGLLVRLTSPGPMFYLQERVGQFGRPFNVIKFRSMRSDAEKDGTPQWAQKSDPRVTTIGKIIRATRIDEIPQIFNVFRGDMSFVGPRPERPFFVKDLADKLPFYNERHVVKPGITGWAQLNYPYGASVEDARHKLEYDLYYVKNYSTFLDLVILIQTVRVILWRDGVR